MPTNDGPAGRARIAWKAFGKDLRACREAYDLGLREYATQFGIDKATLSRAENGRPINAALFVWLAGWMGKDPQEYLAPLYTQRR